MTRTDVVIVGGGPVGLFLGCRLAQLGIDFKILEARTSPLIHSRSIGIHPPSLEKLRHIGVAQTLIEKGVQVRGGYAFANKMCLGYLGFEGCPKPYTFVLALPQHDTERILAERLCELAPGALERGVKVIGLEHGPDSVTVTTNNGAIQGQLVVGCDGKDSTVRSLSNISFDGHAYSDTYMMGDFADTTDFDDDAAIYLTDEGLVESFPLPGKARRWVLKTDAYVSEPSTERLAQQLKERIGLEVIEDTNSMLSSFGVQHYLAHSFAKGRVFLAGDAAHVVSPIGGQGMNLGWLDAWSLAQKIEDFLEERVSLEATGRAYTLERKRATKTASRRAELNMMLGRKTPLAKLKYLAVWGGLRTPLRTAAARVFTMRWL